jgi:hypothetical protein
MHKAHGDFFHTGTVEPLLTDIRELLVTIINHATNMTTNLEKQTEPSESSVVQYHLK